MSNEEHDVSQEVESVPDTESTPEISEQVMVAGIYLRYMALFEEYDRAIVETFPHIATLRKSQMEKKPEKRDHKDAELYGAFTFPDGNTIRIKASKWFDPFHSKDATLEEGFVRFVTHVKPAAEDNKKIQHNADKDGRIRVIIRRKGTTLLTDVEWDEESSIAHRFQHGRGDIHHRQPTSGFLATLRKVYDIIASDPTQVETEIEVPTIKPHPADVMYPSKLPQFRQGKIVLAALNLQPSKIAEAEEKYKSRFPGMI